MIFHPLVLCNPFSITYSGFAHADSPQIRNIKIYIVPACNNTVHSRLPFPLQTTISSIYCNPTEPTSGSFLPYHPPPLPYTLVLSIYGTPTVSPPNYRTPLPYLGALAHAGGRGRARVGDPRLREDRQLREVGCRMYQMNKMQIIRCSSS